MLPGSNGNTALDICLGIEKKNLSEVFEAKVNSSAKTQASLNKAMASVIFEGITPYGFMHSSSFTANAVNKALSISLEGIKEYIESRMQDVKHCFEAKTLPGIQDSHKEKSPSMGNYGKMTTKIWEPEKSIKNELFDKKKALQPMCLQYLDTPFVHT